MTRLRDVAGFPEPVREALQRYNIRSAEHFYSAAMYDADGVRQILAASAEELAELVRQVEGYLPADMIEASRQPLTHHPRGGLFR
jgi:hypothetical protein